MVRSGLLRQVIHGLSRTPQRQVYGEDDGVTPERLTPRELEVMRLVAQGLPNKEIARRLSLAEVMAKKHVQSIIGKLGVSDRTQAAVLAVRTGMVE